MTRQSTHLVKPNPPKDRPRDPVASGTRDAAVNRSAGHNYFLLEKYEAGVALRGTEVKSIREGKANLKDAYGLIKNGEAFLLNAHIGAYSHGSSNNHEALRTRKLLLHRRKFANSPERRSRRASRSSPPAFISATAGSSASSPSAAASRTGISAKPSAAAKPTKKPAPPSSAAAKPKKLYNSKV